MFAFHETKTDIHTVAHIYKIYIFNVDDVSFHRCKTVTQATLVKPGNININLISSLLTGILNRIWLVGFSRHLHCNQRSKLIIN